jgi:NitT/TauT family transport system substrate-binding protein
LHFPVLVHTKRIARNAEESRLTIQTSPTQYTVSRRKFLGATGALSLAALAPPTGANSAEAAPEIQKLRLLHAPALCLAPQYMAEELLRLEGFTEVEYVAAGATHGPELVAADGADLSMWDTPGTMPALDSGEVVIVVGVHAGCIEVFGNDRIKSLRDMKGKRVAMMGPRSSDFVFLSSMAAYIGIDPRKDIKWVQVGPVEDGVRAFANDEVDVLMAFVPQPQELRALKIGHVILNTTQDPPWSRYFCCSVHANRKFVAKYPIATKRALRAILKSADLCAADPKRAAAYMVAKGYEKRKSIAVEVINDLPYRRWREANPEDTIRFHALRLYEVGIIKTSPNKLVSRAVDLRFFNELKKELKA